MGVLVPVAPIGQRTATVLACPGARLVQVTEGVYPPDAVAAGAELRRARVAAGFSLREAAQLLGVHAASLSDLEWGRATFADPLHRAEYLRRLHRGR